MKEHEGHHMLIEGATVVNGVDLPEHVIEELRKLGIPLSWYSGGELRDAVQACAYDRQLIDDPDGVHLRDKLHLSDSEHRAATQGSEVAFRLNPRKNPHPQQPQQPTFSFRQMIEDEREDRTLSPTVSSR